MFTFCDEAIYLHALTTRVKCILASFSSCHNHDFGPALMRKLANEKR